MHALYLPRLGQTMEEGLLAAWLVSVGDDVAVGDPLYEVETEKITTSVEATLPGRIAHLAVGAEDTVPVGTLLAVVADPGEEVDEAAARAFAAGGPRSDHPAESSSPATDPARTAEPATVQRPTGERARAMPRTRAMARDLGLDIETLAGTGPEGLILEADVTAAVRPIPGPTIPAPAIAVPQAQADVAERRRLGPTHRRMALSLAQSWSTVPQFTQVVDVDVTGWRDRRDGIAGSSAVPVTFTDLVLDAVVAAATEVPEANATLDGDDLILYRDVDIALAMDTSQGLLVPVLRRMQELSPAGRARARHDLAERARTGGLTVDDLGSGTITVSNLGGYGVQSGVPLLVAPYAAIVFVGAVGDRVVARDGGIAVRSMCTLAITYDHRVLDGATAARFTGALRTAWETTA